jgi:hypothetical protein
VAGVARFQFRQFVEVCFDRVGEFEQQPSAFARRRAAPRREGRLRGPHRAVDVGRTRQRNGREQRAVVRIADVDRPAVECIDEGAVDVQLRRNAALRRAGEHGCHCAASV